MLQYGKPWFPGRGMVEVSTPLPYERGGTSGKGAGMQGVDLMDYLSGSYQVEGHRRPYRGKGAEVYISLSLIHISEPTRH
eukprot:11263971-Karenia_brevis.AAC.1